MTQSPHATTVLQNPHANRAFLPAIGLTIAFCALILLGFEPHYAGISSFGGNTDDVRATMFASGTCVAGGPSANLLYSNRLIGLVLSHLYSDRPGIPWYGVYLTVICDSLTLARGHR